MKIIKFLMFIKIYLYTLNNNRLARQRQRDYLILNPLIVHGKYNFIKIRKFKFLI